MKNNVVSSTINNTRDDFNDKSHLNRGKKDHSQFAPSVPSVNEIGERLVGTADPKNWIVISYNGFEYKTKADKHGHWQIENPLVNGGVVAIYAMNQHGIRSELINIAQIAEPNITPSTPEILEKGEYLVGKADVGNTVIVILGDQEFSATVNEDGIWSMLNPLTTTGMMTIVALDHAGNRSEELKTAQIILPKAATVLEAGEIISGTAELNSTVIIQTDDRVYRIKVDENGHWSIENPVAQGGTLQILVEDQLGQQSLAIGLAFPFIQTLPEMPSYVLAPPEVTLNSDKLAGNAEKQAKIIVTANDQQYVSYADENGFWSMDNPIQGGGFATIVAEDSRGVQSAEITIAKLILSSTEETSEISELLLVADVQDENSSDSIQVTLNVGDLLLNSEIVRDDEIADEQYLNTNHAEASNLSALTHPVVVHSFLIEPSLSQVDWIA